MSSEQNVIHWSTHIHPLTKIDEYGEFKCGGCKTHGFGKTYRCDRCDCNLHEHCATCPSTLVSFMHPQHELQLVFNGPEHICEICHGLVDGLYYRCEACSFHVHPLCTQLAQHVSYVAHPAHTLELSQNGASNTCMACQGTILPWRYTCGPCMIDVHVECVTLPAPSAIESQPDLNNYEYTNKGAGPSKRRRVFRFFKDVTVNVTSTIIVEIGKEFGL